LFSFFFFLAAAAALTSATRGLPFSLLQRPPWRLSRAPDDGALRATLFFLLGHPACGDCVRFPKAPHVWFFSQQINSCPPRRRWTSSCCSLLCSLVFFLAAYIIIQNNNKPSPRVLVLWCDEDSSKKNASYYLLPSSSRLLWYTACDVSSRSCRLLYTAASSYIFFSP